MTFGWLWFFSTDFPIIHGKEWKIRISLSSPCTILPHPSSLKQVVSRVRILLLWQIESDTDDILSNLRRKLSEILIVTIFIISLSLDVRIRLSSHIYEMRRMILITRISLITKDTNTRFFWRIIVVSSIKTRTNMTDLRLLLSDLRSFYPT